MQYDQHAQTASPAANVVPTQERSRKPALDGLSYDQQVAALAPPAGDGPPVQMKESSDAPAPADTSVVAREDLQPKLAEQVATWKQELADVAARDDAMAADVTVAAGQDAAALEAKEAEKKTLETRRKELADAIARARQDLELLGNPHADPTQVSEVLARRGQVPISIPATEEKKNDVSVGASGVGVTDTTTTTTATAGTTTTDTTKTSTSVDLGAASVTKGTTTSSSTDAGGTRSGTSTTNATTVGVGGASKSTSTTVEEGGKKSTTGSKTGVERGDGKLGVSRTSSQSTTNADGSGSGSSTTVKGGAIVGPDGVGAYGGAESSKDKTFANGVKAGVTTGVDGRVVVSVAQVPGSDPPKYQIVTTVAVGGKVGGSLGGEKEGGGAKGSVGVSGEASGKGTMKYARVLDAAETKKYLADLEAAKSGGDGGSHPEMAIIGTGVRNGWDAAKSAAETASATAGDADTAAAMAEGESIEIALEGNAKGGGNLGAGGGGLSVGVSGGVETGSELKLSVAKKDGKIVTTLLVGDSEGWSAGGKGGYGAAGMSYSHAETEKSSRAVTITLDPAREDFEALYAEFQGCRSQQALLDFAARHPQVVTERVVTTGTTETDKGGANIAGYDAFGVTSKADRTKTVKETAEGKTTTVVGGNEVGGNLGPKKGNTREELAVEVGPNGEMSGDLSQTKTENDVGAEAKKLGKNLLDDPLGVLTGSAKSDVETMHVAGYLLTQQDFDRIVAEAKGGAKHWNKSGGVARPSHIDDWEACRAAIVAAGDDKVAVAEALTNFMGTSDHGRAEVLENVVRKPRSGEGGIKYELPNGLAPLKGAYSTLVMGNPATGIRKLVAEDKLKEALAACKSATTQLEDLAGKITAARDQFEDPAAHSEMLGRIGQRKLEVGQLQREITAKASGKALDPDQLEASNAQAEFTQLLSDCRNNKTLEMSWFAKMSEDHDDAIAMTGLVNQIRELYVRWRPQHKRLSELASLHDFEGERQVPDLKPDDARFNVAFSEKNGMAYYSDPFGDEATRAQDESDSKEEQARASAKWMAEDSLYAQQRKAENEAYAKREQMQSVVMGAYKAWSGKVEAAKSAAQNSAGKCNGMHAKGRSSEIKPAAQRAWSEGFRLLNLAGGSYTTFQQTKQYCNDAAGVERCAQQAIAKYSGVTAKFHEGNQLQGA